MQVTQAHLQEAEKKLKASKPREGYLLISMGYDRLLVLPHSQGTALLDALAHAEILVDRYSDSRRLEPLEENTFSVYPLSYQERDRIKMANLLGCSYSDLTAAFAAGRSPETSSA